MLPNGSVPLDKLLPVSMTLASLLGPTSILAMLAVLVALGVIVGGLIAIYERLTGRPFDMSRIGASPAKPAPTDERLSGRRPATSGV